jgi:hypothetical protein
MNYETIALDTDCRLGEAFHRPKSVKQEDFPLDDTTARIRKHRQLRRQYAQMPSNVLPRNKVTPEIEAADAFCSVARLMMRHGVLLIGRRAHLKGQRLCYDTLRSWMRGLIIVSITTTGLTCLG